MFRPTLALWLFRTHAPGHRVLACPDYSSLAAYFAASFDGFRGKEIPPQVVGCEGIKDTDKLLSHGYYSASNSKIVALDFETCKCFLRPVPDSFGGIEIEDEWGGIALEEESTPEERPPRGEMPPIPSGLIPEGVPTQVTPEQLEQLYQSGELRRPPDWDAVRNRIGLRDEQAGLLGEAEGLATLEKAATIAQEPLIPAGITESAIALSTPALPPGVRRSVAEAASGLTSPVNIGMAAVGGGASVIPRIGGAVARGIAGGFAADIASHIPELGTAAGEASVTGTPEEQQKAITDIGVSALMGGLAGGGAFARPRPAIPPRIVEAIAKADAVGLTKSAQAVADVVKREQPTQEVSSASAEPIAESVPQPEVRPRVGEEAPLRQPGETPGAQVEPAIPREPARAQSGAQPEVLLTGPEVIKSIVELPDAAAGALRQKPAVEAGMKLTEADVPALEAARDSALKQAVEAAERGDNEAFKAGFGKNIWFSGAIEGARRKGPNYDTFIKEQQAAATAPAQPAVATAPTAPTAPEALPARPVGGRTTEQPAVGAAEVPAQVITEPTYAARAKVIADKVREQFKTDTGGKAFTGPVEIINAAAEIAARIIEYGGSGADAVAAALKHVRENWKGEFDEASLRSKFTKAIEVPDTAGETVKMRKSAERAVESPQIPKPVQERIEAAPESRYTQQSMARVEDAVKTMTDAELGAMPADSNLYVASKLEQADRRFRAGDNDGGYAIFVELEKQGTSFGQNINQFKRLAGIKPEYVATVIDKKLTNAGKDPLTPVQRAQAIETTRKSREADLALDKSTDAWTKKPTAENAAKAEAALDKANAEAVELQKFVAKFEPRSTSGILKSVLQGNLLTPISEVANLFGNMSFLPFRALDRGIATGLDMIDATIRGKPRELSVQPLAGTAEALKGVGRGVAKIPGILIEGTGNVIKGETRAGLHPIKAWINQFAKNPEMPTTGGKLTLQDRLNLAIEGTFGVPAEVMLRGLGAGDVPFKEAARARTTAEQLGLNKVPREQWPFAQKFPELFLPKTALEQIGRDTAAAVFQRESKTLNVITNWLRGKGEIVDFLAATVAPYKLTPWNIIGEILSYNPLVAMTRGVMDAKKGNTRSAKLNAGKLVVGSMLTGAGVWLYNKGLLAPSLDERDESQKARVLAGEVLPPNHINISGLKRALDGGDSAFQAGDETADIFRGGGLAGSIFYMTANIGRDFERGPEVSDSDMWMSILRQSTLEQARFGMNQSFLSGVEGLLTAIKDGNADTYVRQWANTVGSIVLPNTLNTISRSSREYKPDFKADKFKDQIKNQLRGKLGDTEGLPLKRDFWGEPMRETPEGRDAIFYHFFDISKNKQVTSDPVELELYRLWRKTADSAVIPSLPSRNLTLARTTYALNPDQYERYAELVGKNRRTITDALVINPNFHKLTDERKIDVLERAYREGLARGRALFYQEQQGSLTPKTGRGGFDQ